MIRVYVAGPINGSGDREENCRQAEDVAARLWRKGYQSFVPHANNAWMRRNGFTEEEALAWDFRWLDTCDAVVRLPGVSPGSDAEIARANARRMIVVDLRHDGRNEGPLERMIRRALADE